MVIFESFFFLGNVLCKEMGFFALRSVHQDASIELSKTVFGQFLIIRGFGWVNKLPDMEKKVTKNSESFFKSGGKKE